MKAYFTVDERGEKKQLNTPGGPELLKRLGGPAGLPFFAFLDAKGEVLVNSLRPDDKTKRPANIGHPSEPFEIDWFMSMLQKAVPGMTAEERAPIEKYLRGQKPPVRNANPAHN